MCMCIGVLCLECEIERVCVCVCVCVSECSVVLDRTRTSAAGLTGIAMATACTELLPPSAW